MSEPIRPDTPTSSEHDFPASSPSLLKKVPKPVIIGGVVAMALLLVITTFPRKTKAKPVLKSPSDQTAIDNYEQQSPITTDPFSTNTGAMPGNNLITKGSFLDENGNSPDQNMQTPAMLDRGQQSATGGQNASVSNNGYGNSSNMKSSSSGSVGFTVSGSVTSRLEDSYQAMVSHFRKTSQLAVVAVPEGDYSKLLKGDKLDKVEPPLRNLTENAQRYTNKINFEVPSGTRIRAVTQQEVNSDHPGYFTAQITSPMELSGYKLLCQSKGNARDRIPVSANKIIAPDGSRETQIPGEVQMKYAGLEGDVKTHVFKRLVPPIASAFVGAGAGYLYFKALGGDELNSQAGRINTADGVVGPPYQEGVKGVQNEIDRLGGDYPNTVTVPQGAQFELLVTESFSIEL